VSQRVVLALFIGLVAVGCGGAEDKDAPSAAATVTVTAKPTESPTPTAVAPNTGENALRLGQTRRGQYIDTTVLEVKQPADAPSYAEPDNPGDEWVAARARQCVHKDAPQSYDADWTDYVGIDDTGGNYNAAGSSWDGWPPSPQYPRGVKVAPGRCIAGWMLFEVGKGQRFTSIGLGAEELNAEWRLR
jgi:hypothetical protein